MNYIEYLVEKLNLSQRKALSRKKAKSAKRNAKRLAIARKRAEKKRESRDSIADQKKRAEKQATLALKKKLGARFNKGKDWSQAPDSLLAKFKKIKNGPKFQRAVKKRFRAIKKDASQAKSNLKKSKEPIFKALAEIGLQDRDIRAFRPLGTKKINIFFRPGALPNPDLDKEWLSGLASDLIELDIKLDTEKSDINNNNFITLIFKV